MDQQLLQKYNHPVPRYTSYPPANHFTAGCLKEEWERAIFNSNHGEPQHISYYIHIPFCKHLCHYCGCNSYAMAKPETVAKYIDAVVAEIDRVTPMLTPLRALSQIHFGGGSPTAIPIAYLQRIIERLLAGRQTLEKPEIAIECHPGYLEASDWEALASAGFNRVSIGIQDFNPEVVKAVNRRPSLLAPEAILAILRSRNISVNLDLMYGLPLQTENSFAETIQRAIELRPHRLVTFPYAHVPWVNPSQKILEKLGLPDANQRVAMFATATRLLLSAGYHQVGLDHFVLPSDELWEAAQTRTLHRNFQGYCTRATTGQVYAFGVTAISQIHGAYLQNGKNIPKYIEESLSGSLLPDKSYLLNPREIAVQKVITHLMCNYEVNWDLLSDGNNPESRGALQEATGYNPQRFEAFERDGLITPTPYGFRITPKGIPFTRVVAAALDPSYQTQTNAYSKPF